MLAVGVDGPLLSVGGTRPRTRAYGGFLVGKPGLTATSLDPALEVRRSVFEDPGCTQTLQSTAASTASTVSVCLRGFCLEKDLRAQTAGPQYCARGGQGPAARAAGLLRDEAIETPEDMQERHMRERLLQSRRGWQWGL